MRSPRPSTEYFSGSAVTVLEPLGGQAGLPASTVIVGDREGNLVLWDLRNGSGPVSNALKLHGAAISDVALVDSLTLATCSRDGYVALVDLTLERKPIHDNTMFPICALDAIAVSGDSMLWIAGEAGCLSYNSVLAERPF